MALLILSFGGCATSANYFAGFDGDSYEFTTASGRSCVYASKGNGGGLSCDWEN